MGNEPESTPSRRSPAQPVVDQRVIIAATPAAVFAFFTDAAKMLRWIGTDVEIDARVGGVFRVVPNRVDVISGRYLEVDPPRRVVFTWGYEGDGHGVPAGSSVVEITLRPVEGGTEVQLIHRALPSDRVDTHARGWSHYLARVGIVAGGADAGPDPLNDPGIRHGIH